MLTGVVCRSLYDLALDSSAWLTATVIHQFLAADPSVVCKVCYSTLNKYRDTRTVHTQLAHVVALNEGRYGLFPLLLYPYGGTARQKSCREPYLRQSYYNLCTHLLRATVAAAVTNAYLTPTAAFQTRSIDR